MAVSRSFFQKIPFLRITSLFIAGILLSSHLSIDFHWVAIFLTILFSILVLLWHTSNYEKIRIQNLALALVIFVSGVFYPQIKSKEQLPAFNRKDYFLAEVCQKPAEKAKSFQTILKIQNRSLTNQEKIMAYFGKKGFDSSIAPGDQLIILAKPQEIRNPGNPFELDYQAMMHKKDIWFSAYLPEGSYLKTRHRLFKWKYLAEQFRDKLMKTLSAQLPEKEERSVVEALTLGYRAELDPETKDAFASTGAMHVLAVSGLHVGLIYFILSFFLSELKRKKAGQMIYPVVIIMLLWAYAFITGFSASVQRATVMFTFVIIGETLRRPVNIFNSLSASALVLLLIDPEVISEVGFQLSYLAVFGIVLVQPVLAKMLTIKNKILRFLWDLFTVSLAAQLATFPLGIYYFNQFPNLFWMSNFLVIPGATIIIWLTFGFFIFSPFPVISNIFAFLLERTTHVMIGSLKFLSELPHAVAEGIIISPLQIWIIYAILVAALAYSFSKQKRWLFYSLILFFFFQVTTLFTNLKLLNQEIVIVYNSPNKLIHLINGRRNYLICMAGDSISEQEFKMTAKVQNHLKLDNPLSISKIKDGSFSAEDLMIKENKIQFLNCLVKLPSKSNSGRFKSLSLKLQIRQPDKKKVNFKNIDIQTGNIDFQNTTKNKSVFNTRDGSYLLSLR